MFVTKYPCKAGDVITLEIPETVSIEDLEALNEIIEVIAQYKCGVEIDPYDGSWVYPTKKESGDDIHP